MTTPSWDELRRLRMRATPGPWVPHDGYPDVWGRGPRGSKVLVANAESEVDAALIMAVVNALPELLRAARQRDFLLRALGDLAEAVGGGDERGLPEAYRSATAILRELLLTDPTPNTEAPR